MALETDFNVSPYYDDYDESKDYHKVLFKPAVALQARELTQLQSILQDQVEKFGHYVFKEGSIVKGCVFNFTDKIEYVKLLDKTIAGTDLNTALVSEGMFLRGQTANLVSRVVDTASGLESQNPDLNTFFFNYISSDNTTTEYGSGEILEVYPSTTSIANIQVTAGGNGYVNTADSSNSLVVISSTNGGNATANIITNANGTITSITMNANGSGFTADDYPTAKVTLNDGTEKTANAASLRVNLTETMRVTVANNDLFKDAGGNTQFNVLGKSYQMSVGDGVIFQKGVFQNFKEQSIIVDKYTDKPHERIVGIQTTETTVNSSVDSTLLDNAQGFANENAPGADRLQLTPTLVVNSKSIAEASNNFLKVTEFQFGKPIQKNQEAMLSTLGDTLARRTHEESGDYVVEPFVLSTEELTSGNSTVATTNTTHTIVTIGKGIGYNKGKRFESDETTRITLPKADTSINVSSQAVSINYGNYLEINEKSGEFGIETNDMVLILDTAVDAISSMAASGNTDINGATVTNTAVSFGNSTVNSAAAVIGTARVRGLEQTGDVPGESDTEYNLYVYDLKMTPGKSFSSDAKSIWHYKSTQYSLTGAETNSAQSGVADIKLRTNPSNKTIAELKDKSFNTLVFPVGQKGLKSIGSTSSHTFRKRQTGTANTTGKFVLSVDANQNFGLGATGHASEVQERDFIIVSAASKNAAANVSTNFDVANTTTNKVTGGDTSNLKAGDYVFVDTTLAQINAIINDTDFETTAAIGSALTNKGVKRTFPKHLPISLHDREGANVAITNASSVVVSLDTNLEAGGMDVVVIHNVNDTAEQGRGKEVESTEVGIDTANNVAGTAGPWCLGVPDAFELESVLVGPDNTYTSVAESDWKVRTSKFEIVPNQKDGMYGLSQLQIKPNSGFTIGSDDHIAVKFRHFKEVTSSTKKGFFSRDSYPIDDELSSNATAITTQEIPVFESPTSGQEFSLRDSIDYRVFVANTATQGGAFSNGIGTATENPSNTELVNSDSFISVPNKLWSSSIEYYLPRKDRLIAEEGMLRIISGEPSVNPVLPEKPAAAMQLGTIDVPVFPSLSAPEGRFFKRPDLAVTIRATQLTRYTMEDIRNIDRRVQNLEYYTSLNLLEQQTSDQVLPGRTDPTLNRFKNGFIVDNFVSRTTGNPLNSEFKAGYDIARQTLTAKFEQYHIDMKFSSAANISKVGDIITPRFKHRNIINQNKATTSRRCTSAYWQYTGTLQLFPDYLSKTDQVKAPIQPVQIDIDVASGVLALMDELQKIVPLQHTSEEVIGEIEDTRITSVTETDTTRTTTYETIKETTIKKTTTGLQGTAKSTTKKVGEFVTDISFQPYIPGIDIRFVALGLRPGLQHHIFFDDVDVNEHVVSAKIINPIDLLPRLESLTSTRAKQMIRRQGPLGGTLTANSSGGLAGILRLPANSFFAGERKVAITDISDLTQIEDLVSGASAKFNCFNFSVHTNDIIQSTRSPQFSESSVSEIVRKEEANTFTIVETINNGSNNVGNNVNTVTNTVPNNISNTIVIPGNNSGNTIGGPGGNTGGGGKGRIIHEQMIPIGWPPREDERRDGRDGGFGGIPYMDPLAQTFLLDPGSFDNETNGYLASMELFFASKDANMGVTVEVREVINGSPGMRILPFSRVHLESSQINTSTDGKTGTVINFKAPVAIKTNKEYCFVIMPDGNSPEYKVFTAKAGQKDLNTQISVNQDWGQGTMFLSTNNRTWRPYLDEDVKFIIRQAVFEDSTSTVDLVNEDYEFLTANNGTINGTFKQAEEVFKNKASETGNIVFSQGSSNVAATGASVAPNFTGLGLSAGDKIVLTANSTEFDVVEIDSVSNSTFLTLRGAPKFDGTISEGRFKFTPTAKFVSLDEPTNTLLLEESSATNSTFLFADGDTLIGCDSLANTEIDAPVDTNVSYHEPRFYNNSLSGSMVRTTLGSNTTNGTLIRTNDRNYPSDNFGTLTLKSKSNEISGTTITKSLLARHIMSNKSKYVAPMIDLQSQSLLVYENIINNDLTNEHLSEKGSASSKYVSRNIVLARDLEAEDIKVFVNAYKPANTEIDVYVKIRNSADSFALKDTNWTKLEPTQNKSKFSSDVERKDIIEYGYEFADTLETTNLTEVANLNTDSKTIHLTANTTLVGNSTFNDLVKLTNTNGKTDYQITKVISTANGGSPTITVSDTPFVNSSTIRVGKVNTDQRLRGFRDPQAPTAFQVTYFNTNDEKFVGYDRLAIKIVMRSSSTAKAPVLQDYRAIAVSL